MHPVSTAYAVQPRSARDVRIGAAALVGAAAALPLSPVHLSFVCPLRAATGIPCPLCGMTRACIAAVHGHLGASLAFNPAGLLVIALALAALIRPQWLARARPPIWFMTGALAALWLWNVGFNPTFHQFLLR
ncbi:MAG: hypothetical protein QOE62_2958 [Actinomycetota bacterium]|nr:hypothetical protein [Actinomycetota bacterium]